MDEKKVREAIELIKQEIYVLEEFVNYGGIIEEKKKKHIGLYNTAIEALEKQLPKKLDEDECTEKTHYKCPTCGRIPLTVYADGYRLGTTPKYCEGCGQNLDWSVEDE